jgi:hypothetical protein
MAGIKSDSTLNVGGPKSFSSEGTSDPGLLSDGITEASAELYFIFNSVEGVLALFVTNTSPVLVGVPNPLITDVYFNVPMGVTGMTLEDQQSKGGGPNPNFGLTFDDDLLTNPNPNGANGFGAFSVELHNAMGITGSIQNPDADTVSNPGTHAIGGYFRFALTGNFAGLTADDFTQGFSVIPPGNMPTHAVCKFQAGGVAESSAFISDGTEECFLVIGESFGSDVFPNPGPGSSVEFETVVAGPMQAFGASMENPPTIALAAVAKHRRSGAAGLGVSVSGAFKGQTIKNYWVQVHMWNPEVFPGNPKQWSNGLFVTVWPGGVVTSTAYGVANGMALTHETFYGPNGGQYLRFPFLIDGF